MKRFFLYGCFWGLFLPVMGAEGNEPTEMTASIKNPSFEEGLNGGKPSGFRNKPIILLQTKGGIKTERFTPRNGCRVVGLCLM